VASLAANKPYSKKNSVTLFSCCANVFPRQGCTQTERRFETAMLDEDMVTFN